MLEYAEEEVPLIEGLREKLYSNEDWEHAFKETLLESMGEYVDKLTAPHMLLISTCVITSGVVFSNYKRLQESGQQFFTRDKKEGQKEDKKNASEESFWKNDNINRKNSSMGSQNSTPFVDPVDELYSSASKKRKF